MKRDKTEKRRLLQIMTSEIAASCWSHLCNWPAINCWYFDLSIMAHFAQEHWLYSILLPSSSHLHSSFQMNSGLWLMLNKLPRVSIHLHRQPAGTTFIAIKFKLSAIFAPADQLKASSWFTLLQLMLRCPWSAPSLTALHSLRFRDSAQFKHNGFKTLHTKSEMEE